MTTLLRQLPYTLFILLLSLGGTIPLSAQATLSTDELVQGFLDPPTAARPKGYWVWVSGNIDLGQMAAELREYKDKGVGTLDIWDVPGWVDPNGVIPPGPPFMGDESVQAIAHAVREAGKIGMDLGLTISSSWNAGGSWVRPEDGVMGIFTADIEVQGPQRLQRTLPFPEIPGQFDNIEMLLEKDADGLPTFYKEVAVLAFPANGDSVLNRVVDISDAFRNGRLTWRVPAGRWKIVRYVCTGTGQPLMKPSPNSNGLMIDHFNADAMRRHLNFFFEKLEAELGDLSKTALKYLYTDSYEANSAVWTVRMPEEFQRRRGYDLRPYLPVLQGYTVENAEISERFLFDYKKTLSDLIIENHYELGRKMCAEKGLDFIAEAGGPGPPIHNVPFESLRSLGVLSAPRGEFWFDPRWEQARLDELQIVKGPASAAHLYDQPRVEAEAFTGTQLWQHGPGDLKATADRAMCEGLTSFVYHTSPHIPREAGRPGWVYNFGTIINTTEAWWPLSAPFHHYLGRACYLLQQGHFVGDVLYYYGDYAPNFVPPKQTDEALGFGYDYDVCNSDIILNRLDVRDGYFVLPHGQRYKVLVLPDDAKMDPAVLEKLAELVRKGGIVVGPKPTRAYGLHDYRAQDRRVRELADQLWTGSVSDYGQGKIYADRSRLRSILEQDLGIVPDMQVAGDAPAARLDFIHRQTGEADIYFLRNPTAEEQVYDLTLRSDRGAPELWEPDRAFISLQPIYQQENGTTRLPLRLAPHGSTFVVFRGAAPGRAIEKISLNGTPLAPTNVRTWPVVVSNQGLQLAEAGDFTLHLSDGTQQSVKAGAPAQIKIEGPWQLRFPHGWGAPQRITMDSLHAWTASDDPGVRHFSGIGIYHKTFALAPELLPPGQALVLDLGQVSKVAKVFLNGHDLGTRWFAPFTVDISKAAKPGMNHLIVEVANVMSNQMTGDATREGRERRTHSNIAKGPNAWMIPFAELPLVESGLLGPVVITAYPLVAPKIINH